MGWKKWIPTTIYGETRGFLNWKGILGGRLKNTILGGIFQYLVKLVIFFNILWTIVLCNEFFEWTPVGAPEENQWQNPREGMKAPPSQALNHKTWTLLPDRAPSPHLELVWGNTHPHGRLNEKQKSHSGNLPVWWCLTWIKYMHCSHRGLALP